VSGISKREQVDGVEFGARSVGIEALQLQCSITGPSPRLGCFGVAQRVHSEEPLFACSRAHSLIHPLSLGLRL
jgi:hypothetical protein